MLFILHIIALYTYSSPSDVILDCLYRRVWVKLQIQPHLVISTLQTQIQAVPVISSLYPFLISFSSFTFLSTPYRNFLLFFPWVPYHFYLFVITTRRYVTILPHSLISFTELRLVCLIIRFSIVDPVIYAAFWAIDINVGFPPLGGIPTMKKPEFQSKTIGL